MKAHRRTHNKTPGSRKQRKKPTVKTRELKQESPSFEVVEMIKDEEIDMNYEGTFEEEFITT